MSVPPEAVIRQLLDRMEAFVSARGTVEIHDPLYAMLSDPDPRHLGGLSEALSDHPNHPLARELAIELSPWLVLVKASLEDVLRRDGPIPEGVDPVDEVRRRLLRAAEVRRVLEARIAGEERQGALMNNTANGMAAIAAFLAVFALMGWLAALGVWEIPWLEEPQLPPPVTKEPVSGENE
jgi:hypothetical protein